MTRKLQGKSRFFRDVCRKKCQLSFFGGGLLEKHLIILMLSFLSLTVFLKTTVSSCSPFELGELSDNDFEIEGVSVF